MYAHNTGGAICTHYTCLKFSIAKILFNTS